MKDGYYSDGVTRFTDPFWRNLCYECGNTYWSVMISKQCPVCQSSNILNTFDDEVLEHALHKYKEIKLRKSS